MAIYAGVTALVIPAHSHLKPQCPYGLVEVPGSSRWDLMF